MLCEGGYVVSEQIELTSPGRLYGSSRYADLTVKCGDFTTRVHTAVVCTRSAWFAKAVDDERFLEGRNGIVEFTQESPRTVQMMLQFLYSGDYKLQESGLDSADEIMKA